MNEKRLERLYKEFFEDESRLNSYNATQKTFIYKSSGVKRNREEFKKLLENPKNFENFWKNFKSVIKKSDGSDWLGTFEEFKRKMMEQDPKCLLNSALNINRGTEEGEYFKEYSNGDMMDLYANGQMSYLYSSNGKKVDGKWKCDGTNNFVVEMNDGQRYSSKDNKWTKIDSSGSSGTSGGSGTSGSGKSGTSGSGKSGTSGSGKSGTSGSGKSGTVPIDITLPYEIKGSFTTPKTSQDVFEKIIDLRELEKDVEKTLKLIYGKKINPKIEALTFDIVDNGSSYTTSYSVKIDESNDKKSWVGFKAIGSAGEDYRNEAERKFEDELLMMGPKNIELFKNRENTEIPFELYFIQFRDPKKFPSHKVVESDLTKSIKGKLIEKHEEKILKEDIVEKRLDYLISQLRETKNYENINQYKRSKLFIEELNELKSCGLL